MINKSKNKLNWFFITLSILVLVSVDFFSKNFILNNFFYKKNFSIKESIIYKDFLKTSLSLFLTFNKGAAFGWFSKYQPILLVARIFVTLGMLIYLFWIDTPKLLKVSLILIISGAIGNIIDFLLYGYVIDFISFKILSYNFPIFNLADCFISIGTILLILFFIKKK